MAALQGDYLRPLAPIADAIAADVASAADRPPHAGGDERIRWRVTRDPCRAYLHPPSDLETDGQLSRGDVFRPSRESPQNI